MHEGGMRCPVQYIKMPATCHASGAHRVPHQGCGSEAGAEGGLRLPHTSLRPRRLGGEAAAGQEGEGGSNHVVNRVLVLCWSRRPA